MEIIYDQFGTSVILRKDDGTEVDVLKIEQALTSALASREFNRGQVDVLTDRLERIDAILRENGSAGGRMYTGEQVAELQASEAELVAGPLRVRIVELETEREKLRRQVKGYDTDRHTERDRADKAERLLETARVDMHGPNGLYPRIQVLTATKAELRDQLFSAATKLARRADRIAELEKALAKEMERTTKAGEILSSPGVTSALNRAVRDQAEAHSMARAIENALNALA